MLSSLSINTRAGKWTLTGLLLAALGFHAPATAQSFEPGYGTVVLTDWPDQEARRTLRYDILPFVDSLAVGYEYAVRDGRPVLSLAVDWVPGRWAIYRGTRVPVAEVPGDVRMAGLDLRFGVRVHGETKATLSVVVDSMVVGPRPDFVEIELPETTWENVFVDISPEEAKAIFLNGFELVDLEIAGAAFAVFDEDGERIEHRTASRPRSHPNRVSIYRAPHIVDVFVDVTWLIGGISERPALREGESRGALGRGSVGERGRESDRRGSRVDEDRSARVAERGDDSGRGRDAGEDRPRSADDSSGRAEASEERQRDEQGRSRGGLRLPTSSDKEDDDDDEDDDELVPYALAAVGAAGILAAAGGTIGYYGSSRHAPLGLTSGFVGRDGGLLLQAAVNEALLFDEPAPKRLMVKLLSFGNFFNSGLQPALGAGVLATSEGEGIEYEPTVSLGAVGTWKMMLFYGGYDVMQNGPEFSVALNFRQLGLWGSRED